MLRPGAAFIASSNHDGGKLTISHAPSALDQLQFGQAQQKAGMIETLGGALPSELVGYFFPVNFPRGGR
jgi:hypothetical protein